MPLHAACLLRPIASFWQLFMFLSSIFNGIIVLEHALVYALNAWVGKRAERVLRIKKLKRNARAVRHAVRLQRSFRNHRIHVMHQKGILNESGTVGVSAPAAVTPSVQLESAGVTVVESSSRSVSAAVDVGIARKPELGQENVSKKSSKYTSELVLRMAMADKMARSSRREQGRAVMRKVADLAAVFLKDANRTFTITTIAAYFIGVFYLVRAS